MTCTAQISGDTVRSEGADRGERRQGGRGSQEMDCARSGSPSFVELVQHIPQMGAGYDSGDALLSNGRLPSQRIPQIQVSNKGLQRPEISKSLNERNHAGTNASTSISSLTRSVYTSLSPHLLVSQPSSLSPRTDNSCSLRPWGSL